MKIKMLGTGHAMVTKCYNTCFLLHHKNEDVLVDAGGGNGILTILQSINFDYSNFKTMIITHPHTDHILGAIWIVRKIISLIMNGKYHESFHIICHDESANVLNTMCKLMLPKKMYLCYQEKCFVDCIKDGDDRVIDDCKYTFFDICSAKMKQFGFQVNVDQKVITCLGDEPYKDHLEKYVENADLLMCEAFCLARDAQIYKPYEKYHSTAKDAGLLAQRLNVKNLLLYHTEDDNLNQRKKLYSAEVKDVYTGNIIIPDDMEEIVI